MSVETWGVRTCGARSNSAAARVALLLAWGCLTASLLADPVKAELQTRQTWAFTDADVWFSNEFSGARLNDCVSVGSNEFTIVISPENQPINRSPWYAFKVWSSKPQTIRVNLTNTYEGRFPRARLSTDGIEWRVIDRDKFTHDPSAPVASMMLNVGSQPIWVASQEMIGIRELNQWMEVKCKLPFARSSVVGASIEGRPIRQFTLTETTNANYVFLISRQHPPEVTGSIGLMSFVDTIAGSARLARKFRQQFQTVVVPLVNPDGVDHGQWRSNLGAVDLNRDWSQFTQPETLAVSTFLTSLGQQPGARSFLFIDFHSTSSNVFYAQPDGQAMKPFDFTRRWLDRTHERFPGFVMARNDGHNPGLATSKAWANATFQIPAITCEFGYSADRTAIRRFSKIAAEEMMRLLLAELENPFVPDAPPAHKPEPVAQTR